MYPHLSNQLDYYFETKYVTKEDMDDSSWVYDNNDALPKDLDEKIVKAVEWVEINYYNSEIHKPLWPELKTDTEIDRFDKIMSVWDFLMTYSKLLNLKPMRPLELYYSLESQKKTTTLCKLIKPSHRCMNKFD